MIGNPLDTLRLTPFGELLTGSAHKTHPTDATVGLGERFAGQTILFVWIARDRAGTEQVRFDAKGQPILLGRRHQVQSRGTGELTKVLRAEKKASGAEWVVVVVTLGWQVLLGQAAARVTGSKDAFDRHRIMRDQPDLVVSGAKPEYVYAAVNHPQLDRAVVFGVKRDELNEVMAEIRRAELNVAAIRVGVAAQLELWMARGGETALDRDLLVSDGAGAMLLNLRDREFVPPVTDSGHVITAPRQASARPNNVTQDLVRFIQDNRRRPVVYLGPTEIGAAVKQALGEEPHELIHPDLPDVHEAELAVLAPEVGHDLHPEISEVRRALPRSWRKWMFCYCALVLVSLAVALNNGLTVATERLGKTGAEDAMQAAEGRYKNAESTLATLEGGLQEAERLRTWVWGNYHAQELMQKLLLAVPSNALLEKLHGRVAAGSIQMQLEFVVIAQNEAQIATARAFEQILKDSGYQVGKQNETIQQGPTSLLYRWDMIIPPAGEPRS